MILEKCFKSLHWVFSVNLQCNKCDLMSSFKFCKTTYESIYIWQVVSLQDWYVLTWIWQLRCTCLIGGHLYVRHKNIFWNIFSAWSVIPSTWLRCNWYFVEVIYALNNIKECSNYMSASTIHSTFTNTVWANNRWLSTRVCKYNPQPIWLSSFCSWFHYYLYSTVILFFRIQTNCHILHKAI